MDPECVSMLASPMDWVNQIAGLQDSNALLGMAAILERPLSQPMLRQAVGQLIRRYPILASRFIDSEPPVWELPASAAGPETHLRDLPVGERGIEELLAAYLESDDGGAFSVTQCHGPDGGTCLVLGVRHSVTDGAGLKRLWDDFIQACDGYDIGKPAGAAIPTRQADVLFESLGAPEKWRPAVQAAEERQKEARTLLRPLVDAEPSSPGASGIPARYRVSLSTRTADGTARLLSECRRNQTTVTAWLAAETLAASPGRALRITVDLRRYLAEGKEFGLGNLSGTELAGFPDLPECLRDRNPMAMLPYIGETLRKTMKEFPGVGSACLQQSLSRLGYRKTRKGLLDAGRAALQSGVAAPLLSNLGVLPDRTNIAGIRILSCFFLPPAFQPPASMVGAITWNGCLTTCSVTDTCPQAGTDS